MKIESSNKNLIFINRTTLPEHPTWLKDFDYPQLQLTGPAEFDVRKLRRWSYEKVLGKPDGNKLYQCLKDSDMIKNCLSLQDLEGIQKSESPFFRKLLKQGSFFAWKSVALNHDDYRHVPCLHPHMDDVRWYYLGDKWNCPVFLFPSH